MKRRDLLKNISMGTAAAALPLSSPEALFLERPKEPIDGPANGKEEKELRYDQSLQEQVFFTDQEMATITVLVDLIIPADSKSGSASQAGVPAFIEFIVKDMPYHQLPMRGGLMWLDNTSMKQKGKKFTSLSQTQQKEILDQIAYPEKAAPEMSQGVSFFNLMRNLTATGFYTSEMGFKDLGYMGNQPNFWDGVPEETLAKYQLSYADWEKHLAK